MGLACGCLGTDAKDIPDDYADSSPESSPLASAPERGVNPMLLINRRPKFLPPEEQAKTLAMLGSRAACCRKRLRSSSSKAPKTRGPVGRSQPNAAAPLPAWVRPADDLEAEWQAVIRSISPEELGNLKCFRQAVEASGLDGHEACSKVPHSRRAGTLLRFLRARPGDIGASTALLRDALDWRRDFNIDQKLRDWRLEWEEGTSARVRLMKKYDFVGSPGKDLEGLPVLLYRSGQSDVGGLGRELGEEPVLLHMINYVEDYLAQAQAHMLRTGRFLCSFVEIYDVGSYGLVPGYMRRGFKAVPFYKRIQPIFEKVYPERVRVVFLVRAPAAFSILWRLAQPMIPETTKAKIIFRGCKSANFLPDMREHLPQSSIPAYLQCDDEALLHEARPWGGVVPHGAGDEDAKESDTS